MNKFILQKLECNSRNLYAYSGKKCTKVEPVNRCENSNHNRGLKSCNAPSISLTHAVVLFLRYKVIFLNYS